MSEDKKTELRNIFRNLIQDESPLVRRSAENGLVDFVQVLEPEEVKAEFVPVFDNLATDEQVKKGLSLRLNTKIICFIFRIQ